MQHDQPDQPERGWGEGVGEKVSAMLSRIKDGKSSRLGYTRTRVVIEGTTSSKSYWCQMHNQYYNRRICWGRNSSSSRIRNFRIINSISLVLPCSLSLVTSTDEDFCINNPTQDYQSSSLPPQRIGKLERSLLTKKGWQMFFIDQKTKSSTFPPSSSSHT